MRYICLYLEKRKQRVRINSATSSFEHILSGVRQGSILRIQRERYKFNLEIPNKVKFGNRSRIIQGPKVWNSLPYYIKVAEKFWNGKTCNSKVCSI